MPLVFLVGESLFSLSLLSHTRAEFSVNDAFNASEEIADSINYPNLRFFTVALVTATSPQYNVPSGANYSWGVSGPASFVGVGGASFSW